MSSTSSKRSGHKAFKTSLFKKGHRLRQSKWSAINPWIKMKSSGLKPETLRKSQKASAAWEMLI